MCGQEILQEMQTVILYAKAPGNLSAVPEWASWALQGGEMWGSFGCFRSSL